MIPRRAATLELEAQLLFVWDPDRAPVLDGVVLEEWQSKQFSVHSGALVTLMCDLPEGPGLRPVLGTVLSDWAAREATVRARVTRGHDRIRLSDGDTEVTLGLRSAVVEAHPVS